jgi:hypothetical protein
MIIKSTKKKERNTQIWFYLLRPFRNCRKTRVETKDVGTDPILEEDLNAGEDSEEEQRQPI